MRRLVAHLDHGDGSGHDPLPRLSELAHAWKQKRQGGRNKGPIPRQYLWTYQGEERRSPGERK